MKDEDKDVKEKAEVKGRMDEWKEKKLYFVSFT